jgi:hypothetical protein
MFKLARTKGEKNLSELANRLFKFEGSEAKDFAKKAEQALLNANPHLRDLKSIPRDTFIIVPEVDEAKHSEETRPIATDELVKGVRLAVTGIRAAFDKSLARRTEEAENTINLAKSKDLKSLARKDASIKKQLTEISNNAKAQIKDVKEAEKDRDKVFEQVNIDIENILKILG